MNAASFFKNFEYLADAPNGLQKVRELILVLATSGRLSKSQPTDVSAEDRLAEYQKLIADASEQSATRKQKTGLSITMAEIPQRLPEKWKWVRFGEVAEHNAGKTLDRRRNTGEPRRYITTSNLYWGRFDLTEIRKMLIEDKELERCTARQGDLLICEGGEAGRAAVWERDEEICFQNHVHRARLMPWLDSFYAYRVFEKLNATGEIGKYRKGVGISNMSGKALASIVFPLPPFEEQKRIVVKVDELMALCDKLEAQQQERERLFPILSSTTHQRFVQSPTKGNLSAIFRHAVSPDDLRASVLALALRGKLSQRDDNDEPSSVLYDRLDLERLEFEEAHKIRSPRLIPVPNDGPYGLPESWCWVRLNSLFGVITDGDHQAPPKSSSGIVFLTIGNITSGKLDFESTRFVPKSYYQSIADFRRPREGDLLYSVVGATYGRPALVDTHREFCVQRHIAILKPAQSTNIEYLTALMNSSLVYDQATGGITGIAQPTVPLKALRNFLVPLPPLDEQKRIVAKIRSLNSLIDHLESQIAKKIETGKALAKAVVTTISGNRTENPEPMKAPKLELISSIKIARKPDGSTDAILASILQKEKGALSAKALWQQSGLEIEAFYQQLRTEIADGWIARPNSEDAYMTEVSTN